jgi:hypothetical protein
MNERLSKLAAVCIYAALRLSKGLTNPHKLIWNATLTENIGFMEDEVRVMVLDLIKFVRNVEQSSLQLSTNIIHHLGSSRLPSY